MDAQPASIPLPLFPGMLFMDRYYIIEEVGSGGFGSVYKALDTLNENRLVAIKEMSLAGLPARTRLEFGQPKDTMALGSPGYAAPEQYGKRPTDTLSVKEDLQVISTLWSEIHKSYRRPKLGYTSRPRNS